ncbi:delta-type opioid receptor-like [Branchiostoma floridae]|uniref:Delta-type opioid receptor-like n=2 Tax=Branchiostoma floridae TaxID=7739 RepID=A0A9J7LKG1_BRAFL|nr:delta-type opioid receptor-like [Branchiostoma floridae]XP_035684472.1 delta-type opioid receptor-like [Branchiostoma floridae]
MMSTSSATQEATDGLVNIFSDNITSAPESNMTNATLQLPFIKNSQIIFSCFELFLAAIGTVANLVVVYTIARNRKMKTVPNVFVLNLAIADFIYCSMFLPFWDTANLSVHGWIYGRPMCNVVVAVCNISVNSSILFLTAMSIERYRAVADPIGHVQRQSLKKTWLISGAIWVAAVLMSLPFAVFTTTKNTNIGGIIHTTCQPEAPGNMDFWQYNLLISMWRFLAWFAVPLLIITPLYALLFKKLRNEGVLLHIGRETIQSRNRVTRMVAVVVFIFILSWLPFHVYNLVIFFSPKTGTYPEAVNYLVAALSSANSTVNPFLYALLGEKFRIYTRKALLSCCPCENSDPLTTTTEAVVAKCRSHKRAKTWYPRANWNRGNDSVKFSSERDPKDYKDYSELKPIRRHKSF